MPTFGDRPSNFPGDDLKLEITMRRFDYGGRVTLKHDVTSAREPIPFTLGPWSGVAYIKEANQLSHGDGLITLAFDMDLIPKEHLTIAQALVEFFGAEIVK